MLRNKIYQNFIIEIGKTFFVILFGLSIIALTVRAVSFLDLIVDSGYPVRIYFEYSRTTTFHIWGQDPSDAVKVTFTPKKCKICNFRMS